MNKLLQRIVTALVLFFLLVVVFFRLPPAAAMLVLGAFVLVAAWEWSGFLSLSSSAARLGYAALVGVLVGGAAWLFPARAPLEPLLWLSMAWWLQAFVWVLRYPRPFGLLTGLFSGVMVLVPAWTVLVAILTDKSLGPEYLLLMLGIVWSADIGAYFIGRRFGRARLAPKVSPGKTWEGAFGGVLGAALVAGLGGRWMGLPLDALVPLAITVAWISIVGDLTVSMFKRNAGLKDSGRLFPGHGGVLDRIDSVTAAAPSFMLGALWLGVIGS